MKEAALFTSCKKSVLNAESVTDQRYAQWMHSINLNWNGLEYYAPIGAASSTFTLRLGAQEEELVDIDHPGVVVLCPIISEKGAESPEIVAKFDLEGGF